MSSAGAVRLFTSRLSAIPRRVRSNNLGRPSSPVFCSFFASSPLRSLSLSARHVQSEPSHISPSASSYSHLSFVELVARTSAFLVDYYEAPTASPIIAAQLLTALQQFNVDGPQRQLKEKLQDELDELVNEGKRRERRLGEDMPPLHDDKHDTDHHTDEHDDDILHVTHIDDDETLEQRIVARPPPPPHWDYHVDDEVSRVAAAGGGVARGKFDSGYSTDQLLVDSLPTLKEEEAVQLGRRDVMKLMARE